MKSKNKSLSTIKGKLSRSEMKNIMAGVHTVPMSICGLACGQDLDCKGDESCTRCVNASSGYYPCVCG